MSIFLVVFAAGSVSPDAVGTGSFDFYDYSDSCSTPVGSLSFTINNDDFVNFKHYAIIANDWLKTGPGLDGDTNKNQIVDYNDLEILTRRWLCTILEDDTEDSYSCEGDFDPCYPCSNAVDEDWDTYALPADPCATSYIYENYTIPSGTVTADFTIKYEQTAAVTPGLCTNVTDYWNASSWTELNCTALTAQISTLTVEIPDDALSGSTLQLRTRTRKSSGIPGGGDGRYYEGKVIWYLGGGGETGNRPPVADAGADISVYVDGSYPSCCACFDIHPGASVMMDGSNSYDPDGDTLTYIWEAPVPWMVSGVGCYDDVVEVGNPEGWFPVGPTTVTLTVSDGELTDTDSLVVTVSSP